MKLACLFSGGKDSTYAAFVAKNQGHDVRCLVSIHPKSEESHLLHYPNARWTKLQSDSMSIPHFIGNSNSDQTLRELELLENLLKDAMKIHNIEGIVHGGIKSKFQREKFQTICDKLHLSSFAPLWNIPAQQYLNDLVDSGFKFIITSVSSEGLDNTWLGRQISKSDIITLGKRARKFGFNLDFEGGEAETFVTDCPLFKKPIIIKQFKKEWDGYRGRFEIMDAELNSNA